MFQAARRDENDVLLSAIVSWARAAKWRHRRAEVRTANQKHRRLFADICSQSRECKALNHWRWMLISLSTEVLDVCTKFREAHFESIKKCMHMAIRQNEIRRFFIVLWSDRIILYCMIKDIWLEIYHRSTKKIYKIKHGHTIVLW